MKNLLFVIFMAFLIICRAQTSQFEKPRYLKHATFVCPIDMTKSYSKEGIIKGNPFSIGTAYSKTVSKDTIVVNSGNKTVETRKVIDTVLIKTILIEKGWAFDVVQQIGSFSIIKFWNFSHRFKSGYSKKEPLPNKDFGVKKIKGMTAIIDDDVYDLSQSFYIVPTTTIEHNSIEFESKKNLWSVGLLVLPIKLRPFATESGHFEFTNSFSLGTAFYWTARHNWKTNYTSNLLLYAGVTSYKADSSKLKERRDDYNIFAFSPAVGWMWEKNNVQLSLLAGVDFPTGNLQNKWVYRNQPWFGIGVGIGIFKINSDTKTQSGAN